MIATLRPFLDTSPEFIATTLARYAPVLAIGAAIAMGSGAIFIALHHAIATAVGTRYRNQAAGLLPSERQPPPLLWRVVWLVVRPLALLIDPLVPAWLHRRRQAQLREAGMDLSLSVAQFSASQLAWGAVFASVSAMTIAASGGLWMVLAFGMAGAWLPQARLRDLVIRRRQRIARDLPTVLDLVAMTVQGGTTVSVAISMATDQGPPGPLRDELLRVLREIKAGRARHVALRALADRYPIVGLRHAIGAIIAAERQGADLSRVLRAQADQRRHERFLEAERLAMQAPVKMLLPLVAFVFPGTFLILIYPVALQLMRSGLL